MAPRDSGFEDLMARVRSGDDAAETVVFRRFVHRLIALAARQFDSWMHDHADVENVVLSAYKSFFIRNQRGLRPGRLGRALVAARGHHSAQVRQAAKRFAAAARPAHEVAWPAKRTRGVASRPGPTPSRRRSSPIPSNTVSDHDAGRPADRRADPHGLHGPRGGGTARLLGAYGTSRTQRAKRRLERLADPLEAGPPGSRTTA